MYVIGIPWPFGTATQKSWRVLGSAAKTVESERAKSVINRERLAIGYVKTLVDFGTGMYLWVGG